MLIIALVLAAIGLAALVFAVVTSNALVAWVCIGASLLGVLLLIVDALRERRRNAPAPVEAAEAADVGDVDDEAVAEPEAFGPEAAEPEDPAFENSEASEADDSTADEPAAHTAD